MKINNVRKAVIDTSVLFESLLINYTQVKNNKDKIIHFGNNIFGLNNIYKKNYIDFLDKIECFVTTSHAIGELQGLISSRIKLDGLLKKRFWEISVSYLKEKKISEQLIELISFSDSKYYSNFIYDIGYVDTGLIELAKKEKMAIITQDVETLANFARAQGIEVFVPIEFLSFNIK
jgi:rRNA-processing protein FCF1